MVHSYIMELFNSVFHVNLYMPNSFIQPTGPVICTSVIIRIGDSVAIVVITFLKSFTTKRLFSVDNIFLRFANQVQCVNCALTPSQGCLH